jgi:hypothetical protein
MPGAARIDGGAQSDPTALNLINQPAAVAAGYRGDHTFVAVLDTGVDYTQPAFGSCTSDNVPTGCRVYSSHDFAPDDHSLDDNGHGTNVAGIIVNVAPRVRIIADDVFNGTTAYDSDILAALNNVAALKRAGRNIVAVNMSLGYWYTWQNGLCTTTYTGVFSDLAAMGITPVIAAGNTAFNNGMFMNGLGTPSCDPNAIAVGAIYDASYSGGVIYGGGTPSQCTDTTMLVDTPTCFSQTGSNLGLWAPGSFINAAGVVESGTSQATPHVAGAVALLAAARPNATPSEIRSALMNSGPAITDGRAPQNPAHRRLDVMSALKALFDMNLAPSITNINAHPIVASRLSGKTVEFEVSWKASDADGIAGTSVWLQTNGGSFLPRSLLSPTGHSFTFVATSGSKYEAAVEVEDAAGNWSNIVYGRSFTPTIVQQNASALHYSSGWSARSVASASGGALEVTKVTGASVTLTTKTSGIALVGTSAPSTGYLQFSIDHHHISTVNTYAHSSQYEKVELAYGSINPANHSFTFANSGTSGHPYLDVDAFVLTK